MTTTTMMTSPFISSSRDSRLPVCQEKAEVDSKRRSELLKVRSHAAPKARTACVMRHGIQLSIHVSLTVSRTVCHHSFIFRHVIRLTSDGGKGRGRSSGTCGLWKGVTSSWRNFPDSIDYMVVMSAVRRGGHSLPSASGAPWECGVGASSWGVGSPWTLGPRRRGLLAPGIPGAPQTDRRN